MNICMYVCMFIRTYVCVYVNFRLPVNMKAVTARREINLFGLPKIDAIGVSTEVRITTAFFWVMTVCSVVGDWQRFRQTLLPSTEDNSTSNDSSQSLA
jgi:hypothetical protein